jgi:hypothetical protein
MTGGIYMKYPIKYAVMEVREKGGTMIDYAPVVVGYIVSKCYICEEIIKHLGDGTEKIEYKVVFPYNNYNLFKDCESCNIEYDVKPNKPRYDENGDLIKYKFVSDLYDTFDDAKEAANNANTNLLLSMFDAIKKYGKTFESRYLLFEKEFYKDLGKCLKYEKTITNLTEEMKISKDNGIIKLIKQ